MNVLESIDHRKRIGERIAKLRKSQGLTQQMLAEMATTTQSHIARIEAGKYSLTLKLLQNIGEALGYNVDFVEK